MKKREFDSNELLKKAQKGDEKSFTLLLKMHAPLVQSLLNRYTIRFEEAEDLKSAATMGLIKAIQGFNLSLGFEFSTYAVPLILGEIRKYFRDNKLLSPTRSARENYHKILSLHEENIFSLSLEEIAQKTSLSKEEVLEAFESNGKLTSLDEAVDEEENLTLLDMIGENDVSEKDYYDLKEAIQCLSKKEQLFIEMRFFQGRSQKEVAERFFMSQVQVSRFEKKILLSLKENILHLPSHTNV